MKTKNLFWLSAAALLMTACTNEENSPMNPSSMSIQFNAGIMATSRVSNGAWEANDKIGVSMRGDAITATENIPYITSGTNGSFTAEGTALNFPDQASDVTFYAYYPYSADKLSGDNLTFTVDGKTDVLYATPKEVAADAQTSNTVELSFKHALSQVKLETTGFPEDIEVTISETSNEATMNITTGTVTASTATPTSVPFVATTTNTYLAIALPCTSESKTLVIKSMSEAKQWTYTFDATFNAGYQYAYKATATPNGISFSTNETTPITVWENIDTTPENLQNPEESEIELTIAQWLNGKTIKPNLDYAYDWVASAEEGVGEFNPAEHFGINNVGTGAYGNWSKELYDALSKSSITFTYSEETGELTATSVDNGTDKENITVTVDDTNKTLTFSENPLTYNWLFTNNSEAKWQLAAKQADCLFTMQNLGSVATTELFANNEVHMSYYSSNDSKYLVINYVVAE